MSQEIQTKSGRCATHGTVRATREVPKMGFPFIVYAIWRAIAQRRPFLCPECGAVVQAANLSADNQTSRSNMYHPPGYVWAAILIGPIAFIMLTSVILHGGARRAGMRPRIALLVAAGTAIVPGSWLAISAEIAGHGWYDNSSSGPPVLPIATLGALAVFVALSQVPAFRRAATAPGMQSRLIIPQAVRVTGVGPLLYLALGHLPALFALPAALGDITAGIAAPFVARRLAHGASLREGIWFNAFGIADLVVGSTIGGITGYNLVKVAPHADLSVLPIALVPTAVVPMLLALHVISLRALAGAQASRHAVRSAPAAI